MEGKLTFYEKNEFRIEDLNFRRKYKALKMLSIFCEFPIFSNLHEPKDMISALFTKSHNSLKYLKYWKFHEIAKIHENTIFRPGLKYQVLPDVFVGLGAFSQKIYLRFR